MIKHENTFSGSGGLAIIPARGGSKRIPKKNIKDFLGKPIIAYSIEAALESKIFDEVMVSTDDEEIAEIAKKYGAKVPFFRSKENSNDFATTVDVLIEVLNFYQKTYEIGCCIYPTAPFVSAKILQNANELMQKGSFDSIYPVQKFSFPIQRAIYFEEEKLRWLNPENALKRSQDLLPTYHDAGQFYFFNVAKLLETKSILSENSSGIIISEMDAQDIDTEEDWQIAEMKFRLRNEKI
jgi:pseudaminic acid cytidylyltransferase